jgi:4-amino-4-deoxy-L-arabinose transferase-like glycosyltransferase
MAGISFGRAARTTPLRIALIAAAGSAILRLAASTVPDFGPTLGMQIPDPDNYLRSGALLIEGGWHWTWAAVDYAGFMKAPLYPIFLSFFALFTPDYPRCVPFVQALLGALTVLSVYTLARTLHSPRAAVIAAAASAVWFPYIISTSGIWQEQIYVPLLLAGAALLARAVAGEGASAGFFMAGAVLGAAALARSMPVYFVAITPVLWRYVHAAPVRRWHHLGAWLTGFLIVISPYVVAASRHDGRLTLIENVGFIHINADDPSGWNDATPETRTRRLAPVGPDTHPHGVFVNAAVYARQFTTDPVRFTRRIGHYIREQVSLTGSAWLEAFYVAPNPGRARLVKAAVLVLSDLPEAAMLLLAPFGAILARRRGLAVLLCAWCGVHVGLTALATFGGSRYRMPIEFILLALAAGVVESRSRVFTWRAGAAALTVSVLIMTSLARTVPDLIRARSDYGLDRWVLRVDTRLNHLRGQAGFNMASRAALRLRVWCPAGATVCGPVDVRVDGRPVKEIGEIEARSGAWYETWDFAPTLLSHYVELTAPADALLHLEVDDNGRDPQVLADLSSTAPQLAMRK